MPLITCLNGHEIELQTDQFGQRIACPLCQLMIVVSPPRANEPLFPKYEVLCENGHVLRVKSKYLGTQIRCPQCQGLAWVTTDRLQRNAAQLTHDPVVPIVLPDPSVARHATPLVSGVPTAPALDNIPVAELDETPKLTRKKLPRHLDDDDEDDEAIDDGKLTKAERRSLMLTDQGLGVFIGSVIGFCSIEIISALMMILFALTNLNTFAEVVIWILFIATLLNCLVYLAANVLTLFTPLITGAKVWFILSLLTFIAFIGWRVYLVTAEQRFPGFGLMVLRMFDFFMLADQKVYYFISQGLFLLFWLVMMLGLWQLGKFARRPLTRQRVMLLMLLGVGCWIVMVGLPFIPSLFGSVTRAGVWMFLSMKALLTSAAGLILIIQHLTVVNEVRTMMFRRK